MTTAVHTPTRVQLTLTGALVGLALGQLFIGPLSDAFGRRPLLLAGTALHVVASALVVAAPATARFGSLASAGPALVLVVRPWTPPDLRERSTTQTTTGASAGVGSR